MTRLGFAFSTRGPQWLGMGLDLREREPVFRDALSRCDREIQRHLGWSLEEEFARDLESWRLHSSDEHIEPAITALQIALCETLATRGLRPDAVIGMSGGEFAAAYAAGVLDLSGAVALACAVGKSFREGHGSGGMLSVTADWDRIEALRPLFPQGCTCPWSTARRPPSSPAARKIWRRPARCSSGWAFRPPPCARSTRCGP